MYRLTLRPRRRMLALAVLAIGMLMLAIPAVVHAAANSYRQRNLVSDKPGLAMLTDAHLVNPWGLAAGPTPLWAANNGTGTATIYAGDANGVPISQVPLVVNVGGMAPTGQVFNPTDGFPVDVGSGPMPARFIFDTQSGDVAAWPFTTPPQTSAPVVAHVDGAGFTGLTLATVKDVGPFLYAADFPNGRVIVFNSAFHRTSRFGDFRDPMLPAGWGPFNVQAIGSRIVVSYAKIGPTGDEQAGPHLGRVAIFNRRGHLMRRLVTGGSLNAPWGLARAPSGFGKFSRDFLVGNFGDGLINAFDPQTGQWEGALRHPNGALLRNDGLWAIRFGNSVTGGNHTLLFSAGIDDETHGLLGAIRFHP